MRSRNRLEGGINWILFGVGSTLSPVFRHRDLQNRMRFGAGAPKRDQTFYVVPKDVTHMLHRKVRATPRIGRDDSGRIWDGAGKKPKSVSIPFPKPNIHIAILWMD
ncbi:MAG: hypothetical protein ABJO67_05570 [Pseudoruegeria sp.]